MTFKFDDSEFMHLYKTPVLTLPEGVTETQLLQWLDTVRVEGGGEEISSYLRQDFRRFLFTYGLVRHS